NCLGLINTHANFFLSTNAVLEMDEITRGPLALVSQSGTMLGSLLTRGHARGIGFSKLISVGNEADLAVGEITDLLVDDPDTKVILLFLETLRDSRRLAQAARRAHAAGKPIVVYKLGRSRVGRELATSHSGAMAGSDEAASAFFRCHGMMRVHTLEALLEIAPLVADRKPSRRQRVAVMTTTGGGAATVVDELGVMGVQVVPPTDDIIERLRHQNIAIHKTPIIDLTMAGTKKEVASAVLNALIESDHCDIVLSVVGGSAKFHPQQAVEPIVAASHEKPLAVFLSPQADTSLELLCKAGIAGFRTPEACADAIRAFSCWIPPASLHAASDADTATMDKLETLLSRYPAGTLNELDSRDIFEMLGVPQAATHVIASPDDTVKVCFPVAAKILSPDLPHKTEAGGVMLNIPDQNALKSAANRMWKDIEKNHPMARLNGLLVQTMETGLAEAIIGYKHDLQIGPVIMLGVGGRLAEIYHDFVLRLAPVSLAEARSMIEEVDGLAIICGYRGLPSGDCAALASAIHAVSLLAFTRGRVLEADLNPVIVKAAGRGVVAVDALVRLGYPETEPAIA
ncbi:MAG: acetate--CoA ligase family protein, partial [Betaproteobacteria bacterium]|nr:acetate--CoA ligase family protein [Betaproteobacteria bacterium]